MLKVMTAIGLLITSTVSAGVFDDGGSGYFEKDPGGFCKKQRVDEKTSNTVACNKGDLLSFRWSEKLESHELYFLCDLSKPIVKIGDDRHLCLYRGGSRPLRHWGY